MPVQRQPTENVIDMLVRRVNNLQSDINELKNNAYPTVPVYDYNSLPSDPIEGQIAIIANAPDFVYPAGGGIQFDTYPQSGDYLYINTTDRTDAPNSWGIEIFDSTNFMTLRNAGGTNIEMLSQGMGLNVDNTSAWMTLLVKNSVDGDTMIDMGRGSGSIEIEADGSGGIVLRTSSGNGGIFLDLSTSATPRMVIHNLPTSAPAFGGAVWNDGGTLKIV